MRSAVSFTPIRPSGLIAFSTVLVLALSLLGAFGTAPSADAVQRTGAERPIAAKTLAPEKVQLASMPSVSAGGEHSCGIRTTGTLWCWGRNDYGQLGIGTNGDGPTPPTQLGVATDWRQVDSGGSNTCAVRTNNLGYCWGVNNRGQNGDGTRSVRKTPKLLPGGAVWSQLSTAWFHSCGIRTNQTLWCWGDNSAGQLGRGNTKQSLRMTQVAGRFVKVSTGGWSTCATRTDGSLWCWGRNDFGQLGNGSFRDTPRPAKVLAGNGWHSIDLSWTHACGIFGPARTTYCWGRNNNAQIGNRSTVHNARPQRVVEARPALSVSTSEGNSCLVDTTRGLWCWGDNRYGQVGGGGDSVGAPVRRPGSYTSTSGGWLHTCAEALGNRAVCWGNNERGQLGNGRGYQRPVPKPRAPRAVPSKKAGPLSFRMASFNALGNGHARPYAHDDRFGPSRIRSEWTGQSLLTQGIQVVGLQEPTAGQLAQIQAATKGRFQAYPAAARGDLGVETTILWDTRKFEVTKRTTITTQFIARKLRRPAVRLKDRATGRQFWVMNVHNAPWNYQAKRNQATAVQIARLKELEATGLPVYYIGDMNEKRGLFCKVLRRTNLVAANGGRLAGGKCIPPKRMRVDWIFGSKSTQWSKFSYSKPPLVRLSTDHWVPVVNVRVP